MPNETKMPPSENDCGPTMGFRLQKKKNQGAILGWGAYEDTNGGG